MWSHPALALACACLAAPAPREDLTRKAPAEVVFAAVTPGRFHTALRYLRSQHIQDAVLASRQVRQLSCLEGVKDRRAWLAARWRVEGKEAGSLVVVRLNDCVLRDALAILRALAGQVAGKPDSAQRRASLTQAVEAERRMIAAMRARLERRPDAERSRKLDEIERATDRAELLANPLRVKRAPARAR